MYQIASVADARSVERCVAQPLLEAARKARTAANATMSKFMFVQAAG